MQSPSLSFQVGRLRRPACLLAHVPPCCYSC